MSSTQQKPSILLIDDNQAVLNGLQEHLSSHFCEEEVDIRCWQPTNENDDPKAVFEKYVDDSTVLVATDYDLTSEGLKGLFGLTIVGWCQRKAIPVGDFSRGNTNALPKEPNLFELRVPTDDIEGARYIANAFKGFQTIRIKIDEIQNLKSIGYSPAAVLAKILGRPSVENQFALYMSRLGTGNSALVQRLMNNSGQAHEESNIQQALTYVLGHLLYNAILRFPGPILSDRALCAYCGTTIESSEQLHSLFEKALYDGPFGENTRYYWRDSVDDIIYDLADDTSEETAEDFGEFNRAVCEAALKAELATHECTREGCCGKKGGYICPFTHQTVCQRPDCSVAASSWIPQGASLSRVERDFYDEWAPLLGL